MKEVKKFICDLLYCQRQNLNVVRDMFAQLVLIMWDVFSMV